MAHEDLRDMIAQMQEHGADSVATLALSVTVSLTERLDRHQETIGRLIDTVGLLADQVSALTDRVTLLEGGTP